MQVTKEASVTAKNLSKVVFFRIAQYPFLALYVMFVPRYLGAEVYGKYAFLMSIAFMCASMISIGGNTEVFGRFVPEFQVNQQSNNIRKFSTNLLALKITIDLIVITVIVIVLSHIYGGQYSADYFILVGVIISVIDLSSVPTALLFGLNELGKFSMPGTVRKVLSLILIPLFFHFWALRGTILTILLIESLILVAMFTSTRKYFSYSDFKIDIPFLKPLLLYDVTFFVSGCLVGIWMKLGNTLIQYLTDSSTEVAMFDIANQVFYLTTNLSLVILASMVPIMTNLLLDRKEWKISIWFSTVIKYMWGGAALAVIILLFTGKELIGLIIGSEYQNALPNAIIGILCIVPASIVQLCYVYAMIYKKPGVYLKAIIGGVVSFFIVSIVLIPTYKSVGCSIATFISSLVMALVSSVYFRKEVINCLGNGLKVLMLGLVFGGMSFFGEGLPMRIGLAVFCALAYISLLFAADIMNIQEISELTHAVMDRSSLCKPAA